MKIKNQESKSTLEGIFCIALFFLVFLIIDFIIIYINFSAGMSIFDFFNWVSEEFTKADFEMKFVYFMLIIFPFFWGGILVYEIYNRKKDIDIANGNPYQINYINFEKEGISIVYKNKLIKNILYSNLNELELIINTGIRYNKYGSYPCIYSANINITDNYLKTYSIFYAPVNVSNLYKIVCFSKLIKIFQYSFTGSGKELAPRMTKRIEKIKQNDYKNTFFMSLGDLIKYFLYSLFLIPICVFIYISLPTFSTDTEKNYAEIIDNGYHYYQKGNYNKALIEYDKALNIFNNDSELYYYRAILYYRIDNFEKAIEEAQKGINCLNNKSVYYNAKNYKFIGNNDIGLYTKLADSYYSLEQYEKAKEAYDYIINHVKYKYTDAYIYRGICYFYMNQKDLALKDFYKHRQIIEEYFEEQEDSEYKDTYPRYTSVNLQNVNDWIKDCK